METFAEPKALVENPHFVAQRRKALAALGDEGLDNPIVGLIRAFNSLPFCFTLQACYGHFVHAGQPDPRNLAPLPLSDPVDEVEYRIAYLAVCIDHSAGGQEFLSRLARIPLIAPDYVQFGSAAWFWERQVNSYALQVEPDRFKDRDKVTLAYSEAKRVEAVRDMSFASLKKMLAALSG